MRHFRYLDLLTIGFVVLLISNLAGPKIFRPGPLRRSAAEFLGRLKRAEAADTFDRGTDFAPFAWATESA